MSEHKPEWYARLRRGPFEETIFDSGMRQRVGDRTRSSRWKMNGRRVNGWVTAGAAVFALLCAVVLVTLLSRPLDTAPQTRGNPGGDRAEPAMTQEFVGEHLRIGMTHEEVQDVFGLDYVGQSVRRDFPADHKENPDDLNTWSALDIWRYDYGVKDGYQVNSDSSAIHEAIGFDVDGLQNRNVESQLVIVWKDNRVERAFFARLNGQGAIETLQIGPGVEEPPPTESPSDQSKP